jgi:arylformamidase
MTLAEDAVPGWRTLTDAERAREYSPSSMLDGPIEAEIAAYRDRSAQTRARLGPPLRVSASGSGLPAADLFLPGHGEGPFPLHVFIHGGYWQELSSQDSQFAATDAVARGMAFAALDYTLAPAASVERIVDECLSIYRHLRSEAPALGLDPSRVVVSGSSAGAHLAAMLCLRLAPAERPAAVALVSGIYDLEPLVGTYVNDALGLDREAARAVSPARADLTAMPPALVACGANETVEFKRQSREFARALGAAGVRAETLEVAGRNHFDVILDIAGQGPLGRAFAALGPQET